MTKREEIQEEALKAALKSYRCSLGISMGVGKTLIGLRYIDHFQNLNMGKLNVLIVAPKLSIIESWKAEAEKFGIDISNVKFTTYLSLNKQNPQDYDLLVLDECHSLLSSHSQFLKAFKNRILGLTGTPPRYSGSEKGQMFLAFCPVVYKYITDDAIEDAILNNYRIIVHKLALSTRNEIEVKLKEKTFYTSEQKNYEYWTDRLHNATSKKQEQMASIMRMRVLMNFTTKEHYAKELMLEIDDKCIVFANTQEQADKLCKWSYHSGNPDSEINLERFKNDEITELSSVLQLNEGVNIPNLKVGIILHAYGNERKSSQRIGRLLRLNPTETSVIHILCYKGTVDEKWVNEALKDLDQSKIKYFDI